MLRLLALPTIILTYGEAKQRFDIPEEFKLGAEQSLDLMSVPEIKKNIFSYGSEYHWTLPADASHKPTGYPLNKDAHYYIAGTNKGKHPFYLGFGMKGKIDLEAGYKFLIFWMEKNT
jgi:hypothetical protein